MVLKKIDNYKKNNLITNLINNKMLVISLFILSLKIFHPLHPTLTNEIIIKNNMKLIYHLANKYCNNNKINNLYYDDFVQLGMITMNKCIYKYNNLAGASFGNYVYTAISNEFNKHHKKNKREIDKTKKYEANYKITNMEYRKLPEQYVDNILLNETLDYIINNSFIIYNESSKKYKVKKIRDSKKFYLLKKFYNN
tara:strand:- start:57 stop:644 length:588 start_codon:yes stop_codon:yes gene_type:complete